MQNPKDPPYPTDNICRSMIVMICDWTDNAKKGKYGSVSEQVDNHIIESGHQVSMIVTHTYTRRKGG